jgi:hypothetical protein
MSTQPSYNELAQPETTWYVEDQRPAGHRAIRPELDHARSASHRRGYWFEPSIVHPAQRPVPIKDPAILISVQLQSTATTSV